MKYQSHYDYLDEHIMQFMHDVGVDHPEYNAGIVSAHGDKAYGYEDKWEKSGLHFYHGVAIFLLTYCKPFSAEVRETDNGWVASGDWVVANKDRFLKFLPTVNDE